MKTSSITLLLFILFSSFVHATNTNTKFSKQQKTTFDIGGNTSTPPDKSKDMKP